MSKVIYIDSYDSNKRIILHDDYIEVRGGDGTLLRAINLYRHFNLPFYGLAKGTLNFLMNNAERQYKNEKIKTFTLIKVEVKHNKPNMIGNLEEVTTTYEAFNEVTCGGSINAWIDFTVHDRDRIIGNFKGGGLIFSTAQGSTGINKTNGGCILPLCSEEWSVTGDKTNKNINYVIAPKLCTVKVNARTKVSLWLDGDNTIIDDVSKFTITKGSKVKVIFNNYRKFKTKRRS